MGIGEPFEVLPRCSRRRYECRLKWFQWFYSDTRHHIRPWELGIRIHVHGYSVTAIRFSYRIHDHWYAQESGGFARERQNLHQLHHNAWQRCTSNRLELIWHRGVKLVEISEIRGKSIVFAIEYLVC